MAGTSVRKKILAKRAGITKSFVNKASKKIYQRLIKTKEYNNAKTIMFYVSKDNEVETRFMIEGTIKRNKKICVPKTDRINYRLYPIMIKDIDKDLELGNFGLHEPRLDRRKMVPITKIDLIITPGIAFDRDGYRLGWGKGYYDRFLENTGRIPKIGLAFDFQVVPQLPRDSHDIPVDMVITEKRIMKQD